MSKHDNGTLTSGMLWAYRAGCCICGKAHNPGGNTAKEARARLKRDGWKLIKGQGWTCPGHTEGQGK